MEIKKVIRKVDYTKKQILRIMKASSMSKRDYFAYGNMIDDCFKELRVRLRKHDVKGGLNE